MIAFYRPEDGRVVKVTNGNDAVPDGCGQVDLDGDAIALAAEGCPLLFQGGAIVEDLTAFESMLFARLDAEAGAVRAQLLTVAPGQELTYLDKEAEARRYVPGADPAGFPMLAPEAQGRGLSLAALAVIVIDKADQCRLRRGQVEALKAGAKIAIAAASDRAAKEAAAIVDWELALT